MPDYTNLKGFNQVGESLLTEQLTGGLVAFFQWALLGKGNFFNVTIPTSGVYGGNQHQLRSVDDPNYTDYKVWQGFRKNWVWETGVEYSSQPIDISGINVNGVFYPISNTGTYAFNVDYPNGRVVFTNALAATDTVTLEYSYKWFHFDVSEKPWFREIMYGSFRVDNDQFQQFGSGIWAVLNQNRVQLPVSLVEVVPQRVMKPRQLGGGQHVIQDVVFHIFAETSWERNQLVDWITFQKEKKIFLYDLNTAPYPLNSDGSRYSGVVMYPDLVKPNENGGYRYREMYFQETRSDDILGSYPLYTATVRATANVEMYDI